MSAATDPVVFAVDDEEWRMSDVCRSARVRGVWDAFADQAGIDLACDRTGHLDPDDDASRAAAEGFRRSRGLLSGEQTESWLAGWGIDRRSWRATWRAVARRHRCVMHHEPEAIGPEDILVALLCWGPLAAWAERLAAAVAYARRAGTPLQPTTDDAVLSRADAALEDALGRARLRSTDAVLARRRLEWTTIDASVVCVTDRHVAHELTHRVVVDGVDLHGAAGGAGLALVRRTSRGEEMESALAYAVCGEVVGPVASDGGWLVGQVHARARPTCADPWVRNRIDVEVDRITLRALAESEVDWRVAF